MIKKTSTPVKSFADVCSPENAKIRTIMLKAKQLQALDRVMKKVIDPTLAAHCRVANLVEGRLILQVDSAAWATRLRYQVPDLLKQLHQLPDFQHLHAIQPRIGPPLEEQSTPTSKPSPKLSDTLRTSIREMAKGFTHEKLRNAWLKLARK